MAKDVDLSSKEWRDLVFEGKNKDFGAYTLRSDSVKRHNFAVVVVLGVLFVVLTFLILWMTGVFKTADEDTNAQNQQENVEIAAEEDIPEENDQVEFEEYEEPEAQPEEETAATQAVTEINIVDEVDKTKEVKDVEEIKDDTRQMGAQDVQGTEDIQKQKVVEEIIETPKVEEKPKHEAILDMAIVEQKPSFPGGDAALYKWLGNNIVYPAAASEEGVSGRVVVAFVVEKDGRISNVQVVRKKHPALDEEAVRVVKKMPKWQPGRNNGQPVRVKYNLPVTFKLQQ